MCAMRRQALSRCLVFVLAASGCALDRAGTEFFAEPLVDATRLDGGIVAAEAGPNATPPGADGGAPIVFGAAANDATAIGAESDDAGAEEDETGNGDAAPDAVAANPADGASSSTAADALAQDAATDPCDQDGDGHKAMGLTCGGDDCCDGDPNVYPGQTTYFATPTACGGYDYDCDGIATTQYGLASCQSSVLSCSGDGFNQITACGVEASFSVCASSALLSPCTASVGTLTQACR
jgi:hypothetical protein